MDEHAHPPGDEFPFPPRPAGERDARVGFCQECGRPLTAVSLRRIGAGVFCFPCAAQRQTAAHGWQSVNTGTGAPFVSRTGPNPARAAVLGLVPGVGAMYNGQYAKGAMHLVVFVVLLTLADNLNWVFYWLVWGWVFYQAFDAYHTARARRDGLPVPDTFGWNDLGERFGFSKPAGTPPAPFSAPLPSYQQPNSPPEWPGYNPPPPQAQAQGSTAAQAQSQEGYLHRAPEPLAEDPYTAPYTAAYAAPFSAPFSASAPPPPMRPPTAVPYEPTYMGAAAPTQPPGVPPIITGARRFPTGALWLIGLGLLLLTGNLMPAWRLSGRWMAPVLLAALAGWSALRRWESLRTAGATGLPTVGNMSGPLLTFAFAVLLALQAAHVVSLRHTWPVLLVLWGCAQLLCRVGALRPAVPMHTPESVLHQTLDTPVIRSSSGTGTYGL